MVKVKPQEPPIFIFFIVVLYVISLSFLSIAVSSSALVKFKGGDQWLWLNHEEAHSTGVHNLIIRSDDWVIKKTECRQDNNYEDLMTKTNFDEKQIKVICNSFFDEKEFSVIDKIIKEKKFFYFLVVGAIFLMLIPISKLMAMLRAKNARRHILYKYNCYKRQRSR